MRTFMIAALSGSLMLAVHNQSVHRREPGQQGGHWRIDRRGGRITDCP